MIIIQQVRKLWHWMTKWPSQGPSVTQWEIKPKALDSILVSLVDKGKVVDEAYQDFSNIFDIVSHDLLINELGKYNLMELL